MSHPGRNDFCPCGSGKKYKRCCMARGTAPLAAAISLKMSGRKKYVYATLIIIFFASVFLRYYGFSRPHGLTFDEGLYSELIGVQLKDDLSNYSAQEGYRLQTSLGKKLPAYLDRPLFKHPPLFCYFVAFNYRIFGVSKAAAVSVSILFGSLMVLAVFYLARTLYDERVGLLAAFLLCISPVHWACSQRIWMETTMSFFMLMAILFFVIGQKQRFFLLASGVSAGLAMLTKYPGALPLVIIFSYVMVFDRFWLKERNFWLSGAAAFLIFLPWLVWNLRVYGNLSEPFGASHDLMLHWNSAAALISGRMGYWAFFLFLLAVIVFFKERMGSLVSKIWVSSGAGVPVRKVWGGVFIAVFIVLAAGVPFLRALVKEAFIWKEAIEVGWGNPFSRGPWYFYVTRLLEFSPLYYFSFLSFIFFFGPRKGDKLMIWSSLWILAVFILLGNYQSRYILPAVPFLLILSARAQVWMYDRLSSQSGFGRRVFKIVFIGVCLYFVVKTLRTDWLIALHMDYGYF